MMKLIAIFMVVAAAGSAADAQVHGSSCQATAAAFNALKNNMTYDQVRSTIGCDGVVISDSEMAGYRTVMLAWDGKGGWGANMNVMIQNGRLVTKSQFGLK